MIADIVWQGDTVLHVLCAKGVSELVQLLLEKGVDYTILNKVSGIYDGIISFHIALLWIHLMPPFFSWVRLPLIWQLMRLSGKYYCPWLR